MTKTPWIAKAERTNDFSLTDFSQRIRMDVYVPCVKPRFTPGLPEPLGMKDEKRQSVS